MSGGYLPPQSSGFRGMSVPETIQLTTEGDNTASQKPSQYRQMQVPDKITLDGTSSTAITVTPPTNEEVWQDKDYRVEPVMTDMKKEERTITQPRYLHHGVESVETSYNDDGNLALKLSILENRINKLETIVGRDGRRSTGPSRFWYVVTFSAWMMLPLAVVYMFYYRRNS